MAKLSFTSSANTFDSSKHVVYPKVPEILYSAPSPSK
jgi:hypothetical protein